MPACGALEVFGVAGSTHLLQSSHLNTPAWSQRYPRIFDLYSGGGRDGAANYFEHPNVQRGLMNGQDFYVRLEQSFAAMDDCAWNQFKARAAGYVDKPSKWGWPTQLFDAFREAYGYVELKNAGYREIRFIPKGQDSETPDLEGRDPDGGRVLMEVKTIHESDVVQKGLRPGRALVLEITFEIESGLRIKLRATVDKALSQLRSIPGPARRILLLFVRLDFNVEAWDHVHQFVAQLQTPDVEIRCHQLGTEGLEA